VVVVAVLMVVAIVVGERVAANVVQPQLPKEDQREGE
jgi:hypothetical protein